MCNYDYLFFLAEHYSCWKHSTAKIKNKCYKFSTMSIIKIQRNHLILHCKVQKWENLLRTILVCIYRMMYDFHDRQHKRIFIICEDFYRHLLNHRLIRDFYEAVDIWDFYRAAEKLDRAIPRVEIDKIKIRPEWSRFWARWLAIKLERLDRVLSRGYAGFPCYELTGGILIIIKMIQYRLTCILYFIISWYYIYFFWSIILICS